MVQFQYLRLYLATGSYFLWSVGTTKKSGTDGKDRHGLRLEKVGQTFSSLNAICKNHEKIL